ncbi:LysR family transcriptional regulator [Bosea sp. NPDC055332]
MMNVRQVETFDVVMKVGSISRAAEILDVTQPVVSRTIAELESALGFSLFDRVRNRIVPTPEAKHRASS